MRELIHYYEALEAQTLWEGNIACTALVALLKRSADNAVELAAVAASSSLQQDLDPLCPWTLGGIILTDQMCYIIAFDDDNGEEYEPGGIDDAAHSPKHAFEALLSRLPPFHVVLEEVLDALTNLVIWETNDSYRQTPTGATDVACSLMELQTLSQQHVLFVLKRADLFDNTEPLELVHEFGIVPGVRVLQRTKSSLTSSDLEDRSGGDGDGVVRGAVASSSPEWQQKSLAIVHGDEGWCTSFVFDSSLREALARANLYWEAGVEYADVVQCAYRELQSVMNMRFMEEFAAQRECHLTGVGTPTHSHSATADDSLVRDVLQQHERMARVHLSKYVTESRRENPAALRAAERAAVLREAQDVRVAAERELHAMRKELNDRDVKQGELVRRVTSLTEELAEIRRRESTVVDNARRREAELHSQIQELKQQRRTSGA